MQVQHKPLITGIILTTLQAEVGETTLTQSTTVKHFYGWVTRFYSDRLPALIIWIWGQNPCLKMTEENVIKIGFVVNLYAETQLEIVAGFDKTPNTWRSVIWSASKWSQKFVSLFASNTLSELQLFIPLCCNFTPKSKTGLQVSSALLRREEQLWLDSVSRWCHVKWPSSEPAPEASRDWQETKLWLQQLWLEASVWSF